MEQSQSTSLRIVPAAQKRLSKKQKTFNQLIEKVEQLNRQIKTENGKLETLLTEFINHIPKLENRYAQAQLGVARALDKTSGELNFSQHQLTSFRTIICWFCTQSFAKTEPNEAAKNLYAKWAQTTYDNEKQEEELRKKQEIAAELASLYGLDIPISEIDLSPEGFARLRQLIQEHLHHRENEKAADPQQPKTKKQQAREQKQKAADAGKQKNLRSIYLSLAKMLHPDTATDAAEKLRKEEQMKKITGAYQAKDLSELLKLELEFVAAESNHLQSLADQQLSAYISSLQEQVAALQHALHLNRAHPRFARITALTGYPEKEALNKIKQQEKALKEQLKEAAKVTAFLQTCGNKKSVMSFVQLMEDEIARAEEM